MTLVPMTKSDELKSAFDDYESRFSRSCQWRLEIRKRLSQMMIEMKTWTQLSEQEQEEQNRKGGKNT
jgi:hypothetical protein